MKNPEDGLQVYLVGGAVRDYLLGLEVKDRDWVVVGTTPGQMLDRGFRPVGKDFPVFLHPNTNEEYALARTERKVAPGYRGFEVASDSSVTLEQDLRRRDLTINAMAMDAAGTLTDPWGGCDDLQAKLLRHVSDAFGEDPVRILRVARFAARYAEFGFSVSSDTGRLMQKMVSDGEVDSLVAERVWQELERAMGHPGFYRFIEVLRDCRALAVILPEVDALFGVPQPAKYHPEIDTGQHLLLALRAAAAQMQHTRVVFAVLLHDLGKGLTPEHELPSHRGHEQSGLALVEAVCERLRVPKDYRRLALKVCEFHLHLHRIDELKASTILRLLEQLDGFRHPELVNEFAAACAADMRGRTGSKDVEYVQQKKLSDCFNAAVSVDTAAIATVEQQKQSQNPGKAIGEAIRRARLNAIRSLIRQV